MQASRGGISGTALTSLAAIGSLLAATSCCLPIVPFVAAASLAGGSAFLSAARPYLLAASALLVAFGFYQVRRAKQCQRRPSAASRILLWLSAFFVVVSVLFPEALANTAANLFAGTGGRQAPSAQPPLESLTPQNLVSLKSSFNTAKDDVRVLLLLSPT